MAQLAGDSRLDPGRFWAESDPEVSSARPVSEQIRPGVACCLGTMPAETEAAEKRALPPETRARRAAVRIKSPFA